MEPPETPGPVFALRAFKSAIFGTPGIEEEYDEDRFNRPVQPNNNPQKRVESEKVADRNPGMMDIDQDQGLKPTQGRNQAPMGSPTKSILLTPGTATTRRKTVSFGDAVVNDEQKKPERGEDENKPQKKVGSITSQWNSGRPSPTKKPRSKLTQSLLDARETKPSEKEDLLVTDPKKHELKTGSSKTKGNDIEPLVEEDGDETINLEEPRSQSGQYWKSEFESYRARTDREIRKLIQYRSVAKSYARKKDLESLRLAEKLKAEEAKVAEVERKVSELASGMVGGTEGETDREEVVKDLVNQTALALQYKQKAISLRKTLERHGVVISDDELDKDDEKPPRGNLGKASAGQVHKGVKSQPDLSEDQKSEMAELRQLARSSEEKASELEKENIALKNNILRVKGEMGKYEERRKSREASLKQREQKLENRNQEYRDRLSLASKERRDAESALRRSFDDEKKDMVAQIESLRSQLAAVEKLPSVSKSEKGRSEKPSRDQLTETNGYPSRRRTEQKDSVEKEMQDSSGKGTQSNRQIRESHQQPEFDSKPKRSRDVPKDVDIWATQADSTSKTRDVANFEPSAAKSGNDEVQAGGSTPRPSSGRQHRMSAVPDLDQTDIPPSSPPHLPSPEDSLIEFTPVKAEEQPPNQHHQPKTHHAFQSPRPSMVPLRPAPTKYSGETDYHKSESLHAQQYPQARLSKRPSAVALDRDARHTPTISGPDRSLLSSNRKDSAIARRDAIPAERLAAASARLQAMPKENRKSGGARGVSISGGKENAHPAYR